MITILEYIYIDIDIDDICFIFFCMGWSPRLNWINMLHNFLMCSRGVPHVSELEQIAILWPKEKKKDFLG